METKTTLELIEEAREILKGHDFYYMMDDYGYERAEAKAKANMRYFVDVTNELPGDIREAFRGLWIATYEYCNCFQPFWTSPHAEEKKAAKEAAQLQLDEIVAKVA